MSVWRRERGATSAWHIQCARTYIPYTTVPTLPAFLRCLPPLCPLFIILREIQRELCLRGEGGSGKAKKIWGSGDREEREGGKHVTTRERVSANLPVPRNPAPATDSAPSLVIHSATSAHLPPPDFLCFPRPSFSLRQSSLSIFRKMITSGRWGE